jgi:multiple antibiotic resistance protein
MFVGSYILKFFGLSLPIVQVGGGLLIMSFGWTFLHQRDDDAAAPTAQSWRAEELATRAFYPLTLPLTVGPGSMSIAIALGANTSQTGLYYVGQLVAMVTGVALVALSIYLCYRFAETIARFLGRTGTSVVLRLSAFIALCIGVQIIWNGVTALILALPQR